MSPHSVEAAWIAEGEFIHRKLFRFAASIEILNRYAGFVGTIAPSSPWPQMEHAMQANLDVEALEFAFRFRQPHHPLKQRIHGLCFICEAHPTYWDIFYAGESAHLASWLRLAFTGVRTVWLWLKGNYLIYKYHLV